MAIDPSSSKSGGAFWETGLRVSTDPNDGGVLCEINGCQRLFRW